MVDSVEGVHEGTLVGYDDIALTSGKKEREVSWGEFFQIQDIRC